MGKGILKNFWLRLISVVIAIVLWLYVNSEKPRNVTFNVSLAPSAVPAGMVIKEILPGKVKVTLSGRLGSFFVLNAKTIKLSLPYSIKGDTEILCEILPQDLYIPRGIEVVKIEPGSAIVKIRRLKK